MRVLLIGSTGRVGGCVAREALKDLPSGSVTIFVRDKIKLEGLIRAELLSRAEVRSLRLLVRGRSRSLVALPRTLALSSRAV